MDMPPKRRRVRDNLDMDVAEATAAGMSYGQWKALHPNTKDGRALPEIPARKHGCDIVCAECGKQFIARRKDSRYCSDFCRDRAYRKILKERNAVTE